MDVMRTLDAAAVDAIDLSRRQATLDDVFLALTGDRPHDPDDPDERHDPDEQVSP